MPETGPNRGHCQDCEEDVNVQSGRCTICGSHVSTPSPAAREHDERRAAQEAFERLAEQAALRLVDRSKGPELKSAIAALRRIDVTQDGRGLEPRSSLVVKGIEGSLVAVPAAFGPSPSNFTNVRIIPCRPILANVKDLLNQGDDDLKDCIALAERGGGASFLQKALAAQRQAAAGLVVTQSKDGAWPFIAMALSETPEDVQSLSIPIWVISYDAGVRLKNLLREDKSVAACLTSPQGRDSIACPICFDDMNATRALEFPCGHFFHEACILPWLESHDSCPNCRHKLLKSEADADRVGLENARQMGWFS